MVNILGYWVNSKLLKYFQIFKFFERDRLDYWLWEWMVTVE